jgi:hypothetical protein
LLSPEQVIAHHPPEILFRARKSRIYPGRLRAPIADRLLRSASGHPARWMGLSPPDAETLAEQLAQLGAALCAVEPPWLATGLRHLSITYLIGGDRDLLGRVDGNTAFGLIGALGVTLEIAYYSGELEEMLILLESSELSWQQQLTPLAERRFVQRDLEVDLPIAELRMPEKANALAAGWANGTTHFVEWTGGDFIMDPNQADIEDELAGDFETDLSEDFETDQDGNFETDLDSPHASAEGRRPA